MLRKLVTPTFLIYKWQVLQQELDWATHLSLQAVLLPPPSYNCAGYAMALSSHLRHTSFMQFWVRVPLVSLEHIHQDEDTRRVEGDSWECWNRLFAFTDYSANLLPGTSLSCWISIIFYSLSSGAYWRYSRRRCYQAMAWRAVEDGHRANFYIFDQ